MTPISIVNNKDFKEYVRGNYLNLSYKFILSNMILYIYLIFFTIVDRDQFLTIVDHFTRSFSNDRRSSIILLDHFQTIVDRDQDHDRDRDRRSCPSLDVLYLYICYMWERSKRTIWGLEVTFEIRVNSIYPYMGIYVLYNVGIYCIYWYLRVIWFNWFSFVLLIFLAALHPKMSVLLSILYLKVNLFYSTHPF